MRGPTHALGGACAAGLFIVFHLPHQYPLVALSAVSAFASLLPDLDNTQSTAENIRVLGFRPLKIVGYVVEKLFKHRGFLHSLTAVALIAFVLLGFLPKIALEIHLAILFGYLSHLVLDALTPEGIQWFYPLDWRSTLLPKVLCITTGSFMENLFFIVLIATYILFLSAAGYIIIPR